MNLLTVWEKIQPALREKVGVPTYETWFSVLQIKVKDPATIVIEAPDDFFRTWVIDNYLNQINQTLKEAGAIDFNIEFEVNPQLFNNKATQVKLSEFGKEFQEGDKHRTNINPRFSFENFVIGPSNRFAHAAALAVAESPAKAYNPLFIYGGVGLGKTHLMHAITNKIHINNPKIKHFYTSSERFTNELIDAIRTRSTPQFRQKYRSIDVLLIDDIHFIAGKESTQEEFFHTFNTLHDSRKQIIISSDKHPREISNLEERLSSRFAWGLITDIQPPDYETRAAILRKKIEKEPVQVPDEVISFIAQEIKTNIRELEGALIRVVAYSLLEEKPVSLNMARLILKDMVQETIKNINVDLIQKTVAEFFNVTIGDLKNKRRSKNVVFPRQMAMYLSRQLTNLSLPEIGNAFGGKDHTTVMHSCKKIENDSLNDRELKNTLEKLTTVIKQ